jgi:hypothetical protein
VDAVRAGKPIQLIILENPLLADINRREGELIAERGTPQRMSSAGTRVELRRRFTPQWRNFSVIAAYMR